MYSDVEKEGKAVHLSYQQKCLLVAYTQQAIHGSFNPEIHGSVGVLDVVGKDRKVAWQGLGEMTRESAMLKFVETLNSACPLFEPCVQAQKKDIEMQVEREKEREIMRKREEERRKLEEIEELKRKAELEEQEEKRKQIKEALNLQTYDQFKTYSEQQYPDNPDQQAILIRQLQEQHYIQYMQQIFQQQVSSQNPEGSENESAAELPMDIEAAALNALANVQNENLCVGQENCSEGSGNEHDGRIVNSLICLGD